MQLTCYHAEDQEKGAGGGGGESQRKGIQVEEDWEVGEREGRISESLAVLARNGPRKKTAPASPWGGAS